MKSLEIEHDKKLAAVQQLPSEGIKGKLSKKRKRKIERLM